MPIIRCDFVRKYFKYQVKVFQVFHLDSKKAHMDQVTLAKNQYRLEQWTKLIQECHSNGMKIDNWCDANDATHHAYYYWLRKIRQTACQDLPIVFTGFFDIFMVLTKTGEENRI